MSLVASPAAFTPPSLQPRLTLASRCPPQSSPSPLSQPPYASQTAALPLQHSDPSHDLSSAAASPIGPLPALARRSLADNISRKKTPSFNMPRSYIQSYIQLSYIKLDRIARDPSPVDSSHTLLHSVLILNTLASAATFERDERERVAKAQDAWYHSVLSGLDMDEVSEMDAIEEEEEEEPSSSQPPPQSRRVSTVEVVEVSDDEEDEDQDMAGSGSSSPATSPSFITFALPVPSAPASLTTLISSTSFTITSPVPRTSPVASGTSISVQFAEDELSDDEDDDPELVTPPSNVLDAFEDDDECDFDGEDDDGMDVFGPDEGRSLSGLQLFSPSASTPTR